uniref:Uncharacterized protein n=1 Tax=Chrysotila carterae TaxID=13221 RepID=A0A7S4F8J4_CHRCT
MTNCLVTDCISNGTDMTCGGGICATIAFLSLTDSAVKSCIASGDYSTIGGGIRMFSDELVLTNSHVVDCIANGYLVTAGGGISVENFGYLTLAKSIVNHCVVRGNSDTSGGGIWCDLFVQSTLIDSLVTNCLARGFEATNGGGVSALYSSRLTLAGTAVTNCIANGVQYTEGGALYVKSDGIVVLTNGSFIRNSSAPVGASLQILASVATYVFPTSAGYWLPQTQCQVYREACPQGDTDCEARYTNCSLLPDITTPPNPASTISTTPRARLARFDAPRLRSTPGPELDRYPPEGCQPAAAVQPCAWASDESLLSRLIYQLPIQPLDADFPFSCVPGNYGSSSELEQSSPFCAGPCRGGTFCPTEATTSPQECPAGSFCPPGSSVPRLCPSATFGNTTGLSSLHQCTPCPLGHACAAGATAPTPCRPGSYADTPKSSCELVPPGNYQDEAGRAGYKPCKPGFACPEGARVPTACEAGTFSGLHNLSSTADCEAAPRGFFAAAGAAAPSLCPAGRFGATAGLKDGQCEGACAAGHFCPAGSTNGTAHACPAGTYNSFNGGQSANSCTPCPAGLFSATAGSSACGECDAGSVAPETGLSKCAQCGAGQYQPLRGMTECRVCATGTSSSIGNAACSICDSGFYKNFSFDSGDACTDCSFVNGIACPRNSTLDNLRIRQGYWRHSEQTRVVYDCRNGENGWTPCAGGRDAGVEGDGYCAPGYEGPVCEVCSKTNSYFKESSARCVDCGDAIRNAVALLVACVFAIVLIVGLVSTVRSSWQPRNATAASVLLQARRLYQVWRQLGMQSKVKQAIGFYQVVASTPTVFDVSLPDESYANWVRALSWPAFVDSIFLPGKCYSENYLALLLSGSLWPWGAIAAGLVASVAWESACKGKRQRPSPSWRGTIARGVGRILPFALLLTFLCVVSASTRVFKTFLCDSFVFEDGDAANDYKPVYRSYLHDDYSLDCSSSEYRRSRNWAYALIALWPAGIPFFYSLFLGLNRKAIYDRKPNELSRSIGFLHRDYKTQLFWWEAIELLRKLTLTGVPLLITDSQETARVILALLVSLVFLVVSLVAQPFKRNVDNWLYAAIQLALTLIYQAVLLIKVCEESSEVCETFGFGSSSSGVFLFFLVFSTMALGAMLVLGVAQVFYASSRSLPVLQLQKNSTPPDLYLVDKTGFHLFLSHTWQSGQDQVAVIKRQLQLCLPGVRIFLDIDDLADISALETYVTKSTAVLLFLSKGYFASRNCLREVRRSEQAAKPLVLVHESDLGKGGVSFDDSRAECPEDLRNFVFNGRSTIRWHRIGGYQRLSLKLIADGLLRASPAYASQKPDPLSSWLRFSGELALHEIVFRRSLTLHFSALNPGAKELCAELQTRLAGLHLKEIGEQPPSSTVGNVAQGSAASRNRMSAEASAAIGPLLLYLNKETFMGTRGARLATTVRAARAANTRIVLVHENDEALGGGPFSWHFSSTPADLISDGLFSELAIEFFEFPHREVSLALAARALGAKPLNSREQICFRGWAKARSPPAVKDRIARSESLARGSEVPVDEIASDDDGTEISDTTRDTARDAVARV